MKAELLYPSQCTLGEGPIWHAGRQACFWVDIDKGVLYRYDWASKKTSSWQFDYKVTMVIESKGNHVILALNTSIARFTPETEKLEWLIDAEPGVKEYRFNDGAADCMGRLWAGIMHLRHTPEAGALYCIDENLRVQKKVEKTTISNGIAWSSDDKRMYYIDSPTHKIQSFLFDESSGEIVFEKTSVEVPHEMGTPDGMAIDEEGMLWVAHWGGFGVYRWNPLTGGLITKIDVPVPQVSSCAFVGENLDYLIITTARENMSESDLQKYPESGDLFLTKPGVRGVPGHKCSL